MTWKAISTRDLPRYVHREVKFTFSVAVDAYGHDVVVRGFLRGYRDGYAYFAEADEEFEHFTDLDGWKLDAISSVFVLWDADHRNATDSGGAGVEPETRPFADDLGY